MKTEIVHASEMEAKVIRRIGELRQPELLREHRRNVAKYEKALASGQHTEVDVRVKLTDGSGRTVKSRGYYVLKDGVPVGVARPTLHHPIPYMYSNYERSLGVTFHAGNEGLLAGALYNREIRPRRVEEYAAAMRENRWHDLLSDPIAITDDGQVVNGQHRLAAVSQVNWDDKTNDPAFLVIWGVDPKEALHADGSRRTANDEKLIASKVLARTVKPSSFPGDFHPMSIRSAERRSRSTARAPRRRRDRPTADCLATTFDCASVRECPPSETAAMMGKVRDRTRGE